MALKDWWGNRTRGEKEVFAIVFGMIVLSVVAFVVISI